MVWGGIMGLRKTREIVIQGYFNAQHYINEVLDTKAIPFLQKHEPAMIMHTFKQLL